MTRTERFAEDLDELQALIDTVDAALRSARLHKGDEREAFLARAAKEMDSVQSWMEHSYERYPTR